MIRVYATRTLGQVKDYRTIVGHSIMVGRSYKSLCGKFTAEVRGRTRTVIVYDRMHDAECIMCKCTPEEFVTQYKVIG